MSVTMSVEQWPGLVEFGVPGPGRHPNVVSSRGSCPAKWCGMRSSRLRRSHLSAGLLPRQKLLRRPQISVDANRATATVFDAKAVTRRLDCDLGVGRPRHGEYVVDGWSGVTSTGRGGSSARTARKSASLVAHGRARAAETTVVGPPGRRLPDRDEAACVADLRADAGHDGVRPLPPVRQARGFGNCRAQTAR